MNYPECEKCELTYEQYVYAQGIIDDVITTAVDEERIAHGLDVERARYEDRTGRKLTEHQEQKIIELYREIGIKRPASKQLKLGYSLARLEVPMENLVDVYNQIKTEVGQESFIGGLILADRVTGLRLNDEFCRAIGYD